ncbi:hypothetical protein ACP4OV_002679 [Aristida adscensionis]
MDAELPSLEQHPAAAAVQISSVRDLLPFLQGVPVTYRFAQHNATLEGFVAAAGYACACDAADGSSSCGYRGKVLSALQFERHAGAATKNQNGHIYLRSGKSLYKLFQELRGVPAEAFPEEFRAAAGVPMTVAAAEVPPAPQGQQPGATPSWEPNGVPVDGVTAEPPSAPAQEDVEMTEEEKASFCLLGLSGSCPTAETDPMHCVEEPPAAEEMVGAAGDDHAMSDVEEMEYRDGVQPKLRSLSAITPVKVPVAETKYQLESYLRDVRGLLSTGLLEGFKVIYKRNKVENIGRISGQGYTCGCLDCGYSRVFNACEFEQHSGESSNNQNGHIFLESGISLYKVVQALKFHKLQSLGEYIEEIIGLPPNLIEYNKWKASFQKRNDDLESMSSVCCSTERGSSSATQSNSMHVFEEPPAAEDAAGADHAMPDVVERGNAAVKQPRHCSLLRRTPVKVRVREPRDQLKVRVREPRYQLETYLKDVKGLLTTGLLEGFKVIYKNNEVENIGRISGQGYSCGCSDCGYSSKVMNACEFEQHSGELSNNQNDHIFLESGISLYRVVKALKHYKLDVLGAHIEETIGLPPNLSEYNKWKASFQKRNDDDLDAVSSGRCSIESSLDSAVGEINCTLIDSLKESAKHNSSKLNWRTFRRRSGRQLKRQGTETSTLTLSGSPDKGTPDISTTISKKNGTEESLTENTAGPLSTNVLNLNSPGPNAMAPNDSKHDPINLGLSLSSSPTIIQEPVPDHSIGSKPKEQKTRDTTLHPLLFKEGGLPDNTLLTYKLKNGEALKQGYKRGTGIICDCCNEEFTPSHFEEHAGMGRRRQPYRNIYTSEGLTLHELALRLQDRSTSNGICNAESSSFDDYPNLTSDNPRLSSDKESSTGSGPIVPLKRTLQERVVETESCYLCGDGRTTIGNIDPDMIVFCNQCEKPCHVKCYNKGLEKKKGALYILKDYMNFHFLCCEKCLFLRARLDEALENCEDIAFLRRIESNLSWRLLSGMNASSDVQLYIPQAIDIFKDAFAETTAEQSDLIADMVNAKDVDGEKDFRGMYCAALTTSAHVVSAAILKVRTEQVAELILIATRRQCRKKGYFLCLLNLIEEHLKKWNVSLLTVPVDPEMAPIWSEKLGFTILSAEETKTMLEAHPLVMFENLVLMKKHLLEGI